MYKKIKDSIPKEIRNLGGLFSLCAFMAVTHSVVLASDNRVYSGPINVPGIESVTVTRFQYPSMNLTYEIPYGNTVRIEFENGDRAKIRDFNANFQFDEEDRVIGDVPEGFDPNQVLLEVRVRGASS
ncbi:hypothetical protein HOC80_05150 [archaeon]|jgi:hypothetical protein|nr:hypothetical protein [archaeon]MBT4417459.1 hypothetical protein [archaeon]